MPTSIQTLIELSEANDVFRERQGRIVTGNTIGPWLKDKKWSPRKQWQSPAPQKKRGYRPTRIASFRRQNVCSKYSALPHSSTYNRNLFSSTSNLYRTSQEENIVTPRNTPSPENCEGHSYASRTRASFPQRTTIPALITLTANSFDQRASFALGKQTEPERKRLVATDPQRTTTSAPCGDYMPKYGTGSLRLSTLDDSQSEQRMLDNDIILQTLVKRNDIAPNCEHEDISLHMKYYRMNFTVNGTGKFSLAHMEPQGEIPSVQWKDVFPHRPLSAATHVTQVPIFRFSVKDFRSQTVRTPPIASTRPLSPFPLMAVVAKNTFQDETMGKEWNPKHSSNVDRFTDVSEEENVEEGVDKTLRDHTTTYTLYNDSIKTIKKKESKDDFLEDYKAYVRYKNRHVRTKKSLPVSMTLNRKTEHQQDGKEAAKTVNGMGATGNDHSLTREDRPPSPRMASDGELSEEILEATGSTAQLRDRWRDVETPGGSNIRNLRQFYERRVVNNLPRDTSHYVGSKFVVDPERLMDSIEDKIIDGNRKLTHSIFSKSKNRSEKYVKYIASESDKMRHEKIRDGRGNVEKGHCENKENITKSGQTCNPVGLVTTYDFKSYVTAARSKTKQNTTGELVTQAKKLHPPETGLSPRSRKGVEDRTSFVMGSDKTWCPQNSRSSDVQSPTKERQIKSREPKSFGGGPISAFHRESTSASLRYKPTSPATSAFVIAAPPTPGLIDRRSVVMPLDQFMQMAMEGSERSFADWSKSVNDTSRIGNAGSARALRDKQGRYDGLLRLVSFATPVNQFIFAKRVTRNSTDGPYKTGSDRAFDRFTTSAIDQKSKRRYRLTLEDFGLGQKSKNKENMYNKCTGQSTKDRSCYTEDIIQDIRTNGDQFIDNANEKNVKEERLNTDDGSLEKSSAGAEAINKVPTNYTKEKPNLPKPKSPYLQELVNEKEKKRQITSAKADLHECLRRQVLEMVKERKTRSAKVSERGRSSYREAMASNNDTGSQQTCPSQNKTPSHLLERQECVSEKLNNNASLDSKSLTQETSGLCNDTKSDQTVNGKKKQVTTLRFLVNNDKATHKIPRNAGSNLVDSVDEIDLSEDKLEATMEGNDLKQMSVGLANQILVKTENVVDGKSGVVTNYYKTGDRQTQIKSVRFA